MNIKAVELSIKNNYKELYKLAHVKPEQKNIVPVWGLNYKQGSVSGFVDNFGTIERGGVEISIDREGNLNLNKKPFYLTWKMALNKINSMLVKTIENINNENVVTKRVVNVFCFPKDLSERISKISENLKL